MFENELLEIIIKIKKKDNRMVDFYFYDKFKVNKPDLYEATSIFLSAYKYMIDSKLSKMRAGDFEEYIIYVKISSVERQVEIVGDMILDICLISEYLEKFFRLNHDCLNTKEKIGDLIENE